MKKSTCLRSLSTGALLAASLCAGCSKDKPKDSAASGSAASGAATPGTAAEGACPASLTGDLTAQSIAGACKGVKVEGSAIVKGDLVLEAGATLTFAPNSQLVVGQSEAAKLIVKGTKENPVTFTSGGDKAPGAWSGVVLGTQAARSSIEGLVVEFAGSEGGTAFEITAPDVSVKNSTFRQIKDTALTVSGEGRLVAFEGNTFEATGKTPLAVNTESIGALSEGQVFPAGSQIRVLGAYVAKSATWKNLGAPYALFEDLWIEADGGRPTLTLAAGVEIKLGSQIQLVAGYNAPGSLVVQGTAAAPVKFSSADQAQPGAWRRVLVGGRGEGTFEFATFEHGGEDDGGALSIDGKASVKSCTFKNSKGGVFVAGDETTELKAFSGNTFEAVNPALTVPAGLLGAIGEGNTLPADSRVVVVGGGGSVSKSGTWRALAAPYEVREDLYIGQNANVTVEPGVVMAFADGLKLNVGFDGSTGTLTAVGTPEKPITFKGIRDEVGVWNGLLLGGACRTTALENLVIRNTGGEAGITVQDEATGSVKAVTFAKCAGAGMMWSCAAKVTREGLTATEETPKAEAAPEDCN